MTAVTFSIPSIDGLIALVAPYAFPVLLLLLVLGVLFFIIRSLKFIVAIAVLGVALILLINFYAPAFSPVNTTQPGIPGITTPIPPIQIPFVSSNATPDNSNTQPTPPSNPVYSGNPADVAITDFQFGLQSEDGTFQRSYIRPNEPLAMEFSYRGASPDGLFTVILYRADSDVKMSELSFRSSESGHFATVFNPPNGLWEWGPYRIDILYNQVKVDDGAVQCVPLPS
jgi:hypothetical protein